MKDPVLRGTRSLLWQDVPIKPPRNPNRGGAGNDGSCWTRSRCKGTTYEDCQQNRFMLRVCEDHLADPDTSYVFKIFYGVFGGGTRLAMPKTICASDSSSLKPGLGATEGVLDKGVSGQPDCIHRPDYRSVKMQDSRLRLVSGWDSPLRGRQAWQLGYVDLLLCKRLCVTLAPSGVYINRRV